MEDTQRNFEMFAQSCLDAKENCTLNTRPVTATTEFKFTSTAALMTAIGKKLDEVYLSPIPVSSLLNPGTALVTPSTLRNIVFGLAWTISTWPLLAAQLSKILYEDKWAEAVPIFQISVNPAAKDVPEWGRYGMAVILVSYRYASSTSHSSRTDDSCLFVCLFVCLG
jgi:hypothetical protein